MIALLSNHLCLQREMIHFIFWKRRSADCPPWRVIKQQHNTVTAKLDPWLLSCTHTSSIFNKRCRLSPLESDLTTTLQSDRLKKLDPRRFFPYLSLQRSYLGPQLHNLSEDLRFLSVQSVNCLGIIFHLSFQGSYLQKKIDWSGIVHWYEQTNK